MAQIERFWVVQPRFRVKSIFTVVSGLLFVCLCTFFSAQGGREHIFSMCFVNHCSVVPTDTRAKCLMIRTFIVYSRCSFVDHWSLCSKDTNAKYLMVPTFILYSRFAALIIRRWVRHTPNQYMKWSQVYFVLSLCFVDHWSLGPTDTNTKYTMIQTVILYSRFASWIMGRWARYTPMRNSLMPPTFILYSRFASLIDVRWKKETSVRWQGQQPMIIDVFKVSMKSQNET